MRLSCAVQNYHWGKKGSTSEVAQLVASDVKEYRIDESQFYAELWMGTHVSGPSTLADSGEPLGAWLEKNTHFIGDKVISTFGTKELPFLLKVLSVEQPLSIQAHPSKELAERLHKEQPSVYKNPNHKPEMALALTPFEALCGFRPIPEIKNYLQDLPELRCVIGEELAREFLCAADGADLKKLLRKFFSGMMTASEETLKQALESLVKRLRSSGNCERERLHAELVERLHCFYPGDVGCFGPYIFNHLCLKPGEAIFLAANEPHAYLFGDCVECMSSSDNVVRAGLTPKAKDVTTLVDMLTYISEPAHTKLFEGCCEDEFTTLFKPPVPDFAVAKIAMPLGKCHIMIPRDSVSICIVIEGDARLEGMSIKRGSVLLIGAGQAMAIKSITEFLMFQAMANL